MKAVLILLLVLGGAGYYQYSVAKASSAKPAAAQQQVAVAAQQQQQSGALSKADEQYLTTAMQRAGTNYRAWREGVTVQNISLPSGKAMKMTVTKSKTGWCPIRKENLYQMNVQVSE